MRNKKNNSSPPHPKRKSMSLSSFPNVAILKHIHKGSFYGIETLFDLEGEERQYFIVSMHIHQ
jgi:hypothetical protein